MKYEEITIGMEVDAMNLGDTKLVVSKILPASSQNSIRLAYNDGASDIATNELFHWTTPAKLVRVDGKVIYNGEN